MRATRERHDCIDTATEAQIDDFALDRSALTKTRAHTHKRLPRRRNP
jgi:hypothetical protein